jgi:hypothetical protein
MSEKMSTEALITFILYAVALAMGAVTIVLPFLGQPVDISLIGIGLFCVGLAGIRSTTKK